MLYFYKSICILSYDMDYNLIAGNFAVRSSINILLVMMQVAIINIFN